MKRINAADWLQFDHQKKKTDLLAQTSKVT